MRKKATIIVLIAMMISVTYIFAIDCYNARPNIIEWLSQQIAQDDIEYTEVGIALTGKIYNESFSGIAVGNKLEEMQEALSHESDCSKLCKIVHPERGAIVMQVTEESRQGSLSAGVADLEYQFTVKNQKDIHDNSYYDFKMTGIKEITLLDALKDRAEDLLKSWGIKAKESIYFKGFTVGPLTEEERSQVRTNLFTNLKAKETNYYEDDLSQTTCAYYGYTPYINDYIKEENGNKTNVQLSFKYDELTNQTQVIIAFPFYNEPF